MSREFREFVERQTLANRRASITDDEFLSVVAWHPAVSDHRREAHIKYEDVWRQASQVAGYYLPNVPPTDFVQVVNEDLRRLDSAAHLVDPEPIPEIAEAKAWVEVLEQTPLFGAADRSQQDCAACFRKLINALEGK